MQAGRELDRLIAEKIFGYKKIDHYWMKEKNYIVALEHNGIIYDCNEGIPNYSTDLNDAWLLVNWMIQEKNIHFHLDWIRSDNEWVAGGGWIEGAETPEMAICKIALKIVEAQ